MKVQLCVCVCVYVCVWFEGMDEEKERKSGFPIMLRDIWCSGCVMVIAAEAS